MAKTNKLAKTKGNKFICAEGICEDNPAGNSQNIAALYGFEINQETKCLWTQATAELSRMANSSNKDRQNIKSRCEFFM